MPLSTTQGKPPRQSHADAVLWYELATGSSSQPSSGTSADALTITGTSRSQIPGPLGRATYLNADAGMAGAPTVTLGTACTIWAWIVPDKGGLVWGRYRVSDGELRLALSIVGGKCVADAVGTTTVTVTSDRPVTPGVPHLLALTYDPDDALLMTVFVDGIVIGYVECEGPIHWSTETPGQIVWGSGLSAHTTECGGVYAELGGDSRAYDSTEIAEMYRRGMGWR